MTLNDAVKRMRGKPGAPIKLTIARKGVDKPIVLTLTRAVIKIRSVKSTLLDSGYGYVRVTQFQEHTGELLAEALNKLYKDNKTPLKGLILDLRNDPGGLLNGAVAVTAAFVQPDSLVVYTEGRSEDAKMRLTASRDNYLRPMQLDYLKNLPAGVKQVPMVVLVNSGSASASEMWRERCRTISAPSSWVPAPLARGRCRPFCRSATAPRSSSPPRATSRRTVVLSRPRASSRTSWWKTRRCRRKTRASVSAKPTSTSI
jgi:hypothetical protein